MESWTFEDTIFSYNSLVKDISRHNGLIFEISPPGNLNVGGTKCVFVDNLRVSVYVCFVLLG